MEKVESKHMLVDQPREKLINLSSGKTAGGRLCYKKSVSTSKYTFASFEMEFINRLIFLSLNPINIIIKTFHNYILALWN
jgi:hypothetical protein